MRKKLVFFFFAEFSIRLNIHLKKTENNWILNLTFSLNFNPL